MCLDSANLCGGGDAAKFTWCRNFADIPGDCRSDACKERKLVTDITLPTFFMTGVAVVLDVVDMVTFIAAPNSVKLKAGNLFASSLAKWVAFCLLRGSGAGEFMAKLYENQCYNKAGADTVAAAAMTLVSFFVVVVISALLSMVASPLSAYYGGKLWGVPIVKT